MPRQVPRTREEATTIILLNRHSSNLLTVTSIISRLMQLSLDKFLFAVDGEGSTNGQDTENKRLENPQL